MSSPDFLVPDSFSCSSCRLRSLCLPVSLKSHEIEQFNQIVEHNYLLKKGCHLFRKEDTFSSIFIIRSGAVKAYMTMQDGAEQITGFFLPGAAIGISGVDHGVYPISAQAIETTSICEINYAELEHLCEFLPQLRSQVMRLMGRRILENQRTQLLLLHKNADARVAEFLMDMAKKHKKQGFSSHVFRLVMSRNEIGSYLGLVVETVSRVFSRFQKKNIIRVMGKEVEIIDLNELHRLSGARSVALQER